MPYRPPPSILGPLTMERSNIVEDIRNAVRYALERAQAGTRSSPGEVDRVVYFFVEGLPLIEDMLNRRLTRYGINVTVSGIFCHKSPKVVHSNNSICELADIAFLSTYGGMLPGGGLGNAALAQAKNDFGEVRNSSQEELYESAPDFRYWKFGAIGDYRTLQDAMYSLWYWSFDINDRVTWEGLTAATLARPQPKSSVFFEEMLFRLFAGAVGQGFEQNAPAINTTGWSRIIHDLLTKTASKALKCDNCTILSGSNHLKGEHAIAAVQSIHGLPQHYLTKCTINETFKRLGNAFQPEGSDPTVNVWDYLANQSRNFSWKEFVAKYGEKRKGLLSAGGDGPPIILGNNRGNFENDGDDDGASFVVFDFDSGKA